VLAVLFAVRPWNPQEGFQPAQPPVVGAYVVERVVDGDTIIFAPDFKVRLIGVNTPETVKPEHPIEPWGPEATAFTKQFLARGSARLTFDRERVDQFGRYLAYVWVGDEMLNEELLRHGLARFEQHFHYSEEVKRRFRAAQAEAKREGVGIWSGEKGAMESARNEAIVVGVGLNTILHGFVDEDQFARLDKTRRIASHGNRKNRSTASLINPMPQ